MPTMTPQQFVEKWRRVTLKERSAAQEHFLDLCALVGDRSPAEADPSGTWYTFEAFAPKTGHGDGFADVWKRRYFAWEYKGKHADLAKAYGQLLQYREALENPPLLVVSDMDVIQVHSNFTNTVKTVHTFTYDDLLDPDKLGLVRAIFHNPERFRGSQTPDQVTEVVAARFGELAQIMHRYGEDPEQVAHFLIRLLFCLFAEDVQLLPEGLFGRLIEQARSRPGACGQLLHQLFQAMAKGGFFGVDAIPYFNGGLFDNALVLDLPSDALDILATLAHMDWANIEPSILGTLFERGLDPSKRAQLGAHYTSREDILLIVEPVLMAPLRRRWLEVQEQARRKADEIDAATTERTRANRRNELGGILQEFAREIAAVQVLDPACGSGNFLYVALRQLLDLWKGVSAFGQQFGLPGMIPMGNAESPYPSQLHGIEVNVYAHELAQATIWIGYLQWLRENGYGYPSEPILRPLDSILHMDAILAYDDAGNPVEPTWPRADVIIGNPPFLGGNKIRQELGDAYVDDLFKLYDGRVPAFADLVCYWFERARGLIEQWDVRRAGLLATQGIRGGANRTVLERIKASGDIFMAWADREWVLNGAAVHVSMVGFDGGNERKKVLDGHPTDTINADLTNLVDLTPATALRENESLGYRGNQKGAAFDIDADTAREMLAQPLNPNGRPNSDVVRPWWNGIDVTRRPRNMWIIDFGVSMALADAACYEAPLEHVKEQVLPVRLKNRNKARRELWWIHTRPRPAMRAAIAPLGRYVVTPHVSKHRLFAWLTNEIVPDHQLIVFARDDDYFFGVLHSRAHELWSRRKGTQLREASSGCRYTPTSTFETYPFPWPPGQEPGSVTPGEEDDPLVRAIAVAARELVAKRQTWLNPEGASEKELKKRTLTNLYNKRPTWLDLAHRKLDEAVFAAYGWPADMSDQEVLERLLALNLQRAS